MDSLDFRDILVSAGLTTPQRMAAIASIVGRMAAPGSERATYQWLTRRGALGEWLGFDFETTPVTALYRVSDILVKNRKSIESQLFGKLQTPFGLECAVTLYDLTDRYF